MCEYSYSSPKLQIATEDIVVYKYVSVPLHPWYIPKIFLKYCIFQGKALTKGEIIEERLEAFRETEYYYNLYVSGWGIYSFQKKTTITNSKFIIPKGSKFYMTYNSQFESNVYISDKIKFIRFLL